MTRRVIAYGLVVLVVLPVPLGFLWLLMKARPPGYTEPYDYTTQQIEDQAARFAPVQSQFANTLLDESNATPLDVTVTDAMINGHIRTASAAERSRLPAGITNPQVVFTPDAVVLMARATVRNVNAVISIHTVASATEDGRLCLRVVRMAAGLVPMPDALVGLLAEHADSRIQSLERKLEAARTDKDRRRAGGVELDLMKAVRQLLRGEETVIDTRRHHLCLDSVEMMEGRLRIIGRRVDKVAPPAPPVGAASGEPAELPEVGPVVRGAQEPVPASRPLAVQAELEHVGDL